MIQAAYVCPPMTVSPSELIIRDYTALDLAAISEIYNESILQGGITMDCEYQSVEQTASMVAKFSTRETILVAERQEQILGWGILKRYSDRPGYRVCCETSIYLSLKERGKGHGRRLQTQLLERAQELGYHHVVAKILKANHRSIEFHQQFEFEIVGVQKEVGFYGGRWHDVVIMQRIFPHIPPYRPDLA